MNSSQVQYRNSPSHIFFEIDVLENFTIFTRKQLCWSLFLMAFSSATLLKRDSNTGVYLWILKNVKELLFADHFRWLLLTIMYLVNVMFYWVNSWKLYESNYGSGYSLETFKSPIPTSIHSSKFKTFPYFKTVISWIL